MTQLADDQPPAAGGTPRLAVDQTYTLTDLDALNALLLVGCREDEARILDGRTEPVGAAMTAERPHLLPRAAEGFDLAKVVFPFVDKRGWCESGGRAATAKA